MRHNENLKAPGNGGVQEHTAPSSDPAGAASVCGSSSLILTGDERSEGRGGGGVVKGDDTV